MADNEELSKALDKATDAIKRLESELAEAQRLAADRLEQMQADRKQALGWKRDAERYRLLRRGQHWSVVNGVGDELIAELLDAAIDAAMSTQAGEKGGE